MRPFGEDETELVGLVVQVVNAAHALVQAHHAVEREDGVLVGVDDEQRARGHERGDLRVIPAVGVHHEHAVAVALDAAVHDVTLQVHDASGGTGHLDALVQRGNPPRVSAAAAAARHAEALAVHVLARLEIVERADAVPRLRSGGGVTARVPPPHILAVGAVVDALDFAELNGVHDHADVAVAREPRAPVLVADLVAVAHAVGLHDRVAADVEDGGGGRGKLLRHIDIRRDVETGAGLVMQFLHREVRVVERAGDGRLQVRLRRQGVEAEHLKELLARGDFGFVPVLQRADVRERALAQRARLGAEILGEHPVAGRGVGGELAVGISVSGGGSGEREQDKRSGE